MVATKQECATKVQRARAELDSCREELQLTQRQWADYTRVAEKEKARLREVAATAVNNQRIADAYEAQARRVMIDAFR